MARKSASSSAATGTNSKEMESSHAGGLTGNVKTNASTEPSNSQEDEFENIRFHDPTGGRPMPCDESFYPGGCRSLTAIGEQAFAIGFLFASSLAGLLWLTIDGVDPLWRLPAFIACLGVFHFLEYETTARYNVLTLRSSSFLLFTNGAAYNIAYASCIVEIIVSRVFFPEFQAAWVNRYTIGAGLALVVLGQVVRSTAMCTAGSNFNHTPAMTKRDGHELVTNGIYGYLRHPSYFGFFWWAVGTQLLVGNKFCLLGYILVLWQFFNHRIISKCIRVSIK